MFIPVISFWLSENVSSRSNRFSFEWFCFATLMGQLVDEVQHRLYGLDQFAWTTSLVRPFGRFVS